MVGQHTYTVGQTLGKHLGKIHNCFACLLKFVSIRMVVSLTRRLGWGSLSAYGWKPQPATRLKKFISKWMVEAAGTSIRKICQHSAGRWPRLAPRSVVHAHSADKFWLVRATRRKLLGQRWGSAVADGDHPFSFLAAWWLAATLELWWGNAGTTIGELWSSAEARLGYRWGGRGLPVFPPCCLACTARGVLALHNWVTMRGNNFRAMSHKEHLIQDIQRQW